MIETNKSMQNRTKKPVLATLRALGIGGSVSFPANRASYVKSACVAFGFEWNKKFTTTTDRQTRSIIVTRTA